MKAELGKLFWHDQSKTAGLANAATFGLVAGDTTPITNDNTYYIKPTDPDKFAEVVAAIGHYWLTINELPPP